MLNARRWSLWAVIVLLVCSLSVPVSAQRKKKSDASTATTTSDAANSSDQTSDTGTKKKRSRKSKKEADAADSSTAPTATTTRGTNPATPSSGAHVDINNASQKELEELPGVGAVTAKKIIQNRPYSDVSELSKAGISQSTISKITPLVSAGAARSSSRRSKKETESAPASAPASTPASTPSSSSTPAATTTRGTAHSTSASDTAADRGTPGNGNVWVNLDTGVYHREGARWYGKTKNGKYMNEQDAIKAGYRASKR